MKKRFEYNFSDINLREKDIERRRREEWFSKFEELY